MFSGVVIHQPKAGCGILLDSGFHTQRIRTAGIRCITRQLGRGAVILITPPGGAGGFAATTVTSPGMHRATMAHVIVLCRTGFLPSFRLSHFITSGSVSRAG